MAEQRINEYIEGKYGKLGVDRYASFYACIVVKSFLMSGHTAIDFLLFKFWIK